MTGTLEVLAVVREKVQPKGASRHGLVIGIDYAHPKLRLPGAPADARAIYELMVDPQCGLFPEANVQLLLNEMVTERNIRTALSHLSRRVSRGDTVWVYYAGHAAKEGNDAYWINYDADVDDLRGTALPADLVAGTVEKLQADRLVLILDCCYAAVFDAQRARPRKALNAEELLNSYPFFRRVCPAFRSGFEIHFMRKRSVMRAQAR